MTDIPLLRVEEAAALLGIGLKKLRSLHLPSEGVRPRRYRESVLREWLTANGTAEERRRRQARDQFTRYRRWVDRNGNGKPASSHALYYTWRGIVRRTGDPEDPDYGARGIDLYPPWKDDPVAFFDYIESLGARRPGDSIDRIDNERGYWPGNLRIADAVMQNNNRRNCVGYHWDECPEHLGCLCPQPCPGGESCPEVAVMREGREALTPGFWAQFHRAEPVTRAVEEAQLCLCPPGCDGDELTCHETYIWATLRAEVARTAPDSDEPLSLAGREDEAVSFLNL